MEKYTGVTMDMQQAKHWPCLSNYLKNCQTDQMMGLKCRNLGLLKLANQDQKTFSVHDPVI